MGKYALTEYPRALRSFVENRVLQRPFSITLELTRRCNARCDYCNHWQEQRQAEQEVRDYARVIEALRPFHVVVCGGEPFMRRDAIEIFRTVKSAPGPWRYVMIITNGWFLNERKARETMEARVDQVSISLNWPDERQDEDRKLPGLFQRIATIVPWMTSRGAKVELNCILMKDNIEELVPIAHLARRWGATVMYTLYSELQADNHSHLFPPEQVVRLEAALAELGRLKRATGVVSNSQWYFDKIPSYLRGEVIPGCTAGKKTVHISPGGMVRACCYLPLVSHFSKYDARSA